MNAACTLAACRFAHATSTEGRGAVHPPMHTQAGQPSSESSARQSSGQRIPVSVHCQTGAQPRCSAPPSQAQSCAGQWSGQWTIRYAVERMLRPSFSRQTVPPRGARR
jgi:hypothetical protein